MFLKIIEEGVSGGVYSSLVEQRIDGLDESFLDVIRVSEHQNREDYLHDDDHEQENGVLCYKTNISWLNY